MGLGPRWSRLARPAALAIATLALSAPAAQAGWSRPFDFAPPGTLDALPSQIAFSNRGAVAVAYGLFDVDAPASSQAYVTVRTPSGVVGAPQPIPGAQQVLGLTFDGPSLELVTGSSPPSLACCSSAEAVALAPTGVFSRPRTLVGGLAGATLGRILTLGDGRMVAAVATARGVWANQSTRADRFATTHLLAGRADVPQSLATANVGRVGSAVAWTAARFSGQDARSIFVAAGSRVSAPRRARVALTVPAGRGIDQLGLARGPSEATAAWTESWQDRRGRRHSIADVAGLSGHPHAQTLSAPGQAVSGLSLAGNAAGALAVVWESCGPAGPCLVSAAVRGAHGTFPRAVSLGAIDATQSPSVAVARDGEVLVVWVQGGHPMAAERPAHGRRFGASSLLSGTRFAADLAVAFGSAHEAVATWTQGTLNPSVVGAVFDGR